MVWIHGGAFVAGGSSTPLYDGAALASRGDVVVITVNFRLGALGLLAHPALTETEDGPFANWALLDILAALRWVSEHAASFGGDPRNVTIFGQSTGSEAILALLASGAASGLVQKAIIQSGPPRARALASAAEIAEQLAEQVGVSSVPALRDVPTAAIVNAQRSVGPQVGLPFLPVIDGHLLDRAPEALLAAGAAGGIPVLAGTTRDEWRWWGPRDPAARNLDWAGLRERLSARFGGAANEVIDVIRYERVAAGETADPGDVWFAVQTEAVFRVETIRMADSVSAHGPVHAYLFTLRSPAMDGWLGACHCLDIPFVFGTHNLSGLSDWTGTGSEIERLSRTMMDLWLSFARTGQPAAGGTPWPTYDPTHRLTLTLAAEPAVTPAPFDAERRIVDARLPR
jgi:para-nitrobenzyl esterase